MDPVSSDYVRKAFY